MDSESSMKKILRHKVSREDIPDDVLANIILILPMEALLRCKAVCKLWLKIIRSPYFAYKRLEEEKKGAMLDPVVLLECYPSFDSNENLLNYIFHILREDDFGDVTWKPKMKYETDEESINREDIPVVGACKGLICITVDNEFHITNPLHSNDIYTVPFPSEDASCRAYDHLYYGFGYDELAKSFKIVFLFMCRFDSGIDHSHHSHAPLVYEFGSSSSSHSWRQLSSGTSVPCIQLYDTTSVLVAGHLHWIAEVNHDLVFKIMSFNLSNEVFEITSIPEEVKGRFDLESEVNHAMLIDLDGTLGLLEVVIYKYIKIWVLVDDNNKDDKIKKKKWIEKIHIDCDELGTWEVNNLCFFKPCHILLKMNNKEYYAYNTETGSFFVLPELGRSCILTHQVSLISPSSLNHVATFINN